VDKGCKEWQIVTSKMKFTPPVTFILNCGWAGDDVDQPSGGMMLWHGSYDQGAFCAGTRNAFLPELFRVGAQIGKNKLFDVDTFVGNGNKIRVDWNADNTITLASLKEGKWVVAASGKGFDAKEANIVLGAVPLGGGGLGMWFGDLRAYKR